MATDKDVKQAKIDILKEAAKRIEAKARAQTGRKNDPGLREAAAMLLDMIEEL